MQQRPNLVHEFYGIWGNRSLNISQFPCVAMLSFSLNGTAYVLRLASPSSCSELVKFLDAECCHISVFNRNAEESNFLEFGRLRVEFSDEDNVIGSLVADDVTLVEGT